MKILLLTNVPSPYRVRFFNELGRLCELTVLYQKRVSSERNSKWVAKSENNYKSVFLKGISTGVDNAFCPGVIKYFSKKYDAIIICGYASPTEILAVEWCKIRKIPYILEGDGAFVKSESSIKEKLKKHLISGGTLFLSTCKEHDNYYIHYGADPTKIRRYLFSSLLKADILSKPVAMNDKKNIRNKLGMKEGQIVLAVGQFIYRKGFDILMHAAKKIDNSVGIYIVGDTPTDEYLSLLQKLKLENVHFVGFKTKTELIEYYQASDVFVLPTREDIWGLVINEAMANGLPIVTTDRCNAGLELVENGINGFVVPVNDKNELKNAIMRVLAAKSDMGVASIHKISEYTIENMAKQHITLLQENQH